MHLHTEVAGKVYKILRVALVGYVRHHHVGRHDGEAGLEHTHTCRHEFEQRQRVLTSRHGNKDAVALLDEVILRRSLVKLVAEAVQEEFFFGAHFV